MTIYFGSRAQKIKTDNKLTKKTTRDITNNSRKQEEKDTNNRHTKNTNKNRRRQ